MGGFSYHPSLSGRHVRLIQRTEQIRFLDHGTRTFKMITLCPTLINVQSDKRTYL
jgi:hypothetical protein